jgi:succinyl-diaminopimelate desuccinylase
MSITRKNIVDWTIEMCKARTVNPPGDEYLLKNFLINLFESMGCSVKVYEKERGRTNIVGRIKGRKEGKRVAIVGHVDVVSVDGQQWDEDPFEASIVDDRIIARGSVDNKGPFSATLEAIRVFVEGVGDNFEGELVILALADEEQGSQMGIRYLLEEIDLDCDYALIPDGGEWNVLSIGEMGIYSLDITSYGEASHGSIPEFGYNAIYPLSILVQKIYEYPWNQIKGDTSFDPVVLNIGTISGGNAPNIVPDLASVSCMWRYPLGVDHKEIENAIAEIIKSVSLVHPESKFSISQRALSQPFLIDKDSDLVRTIQNVAKSLNLEVPMPETMRGETIAKYLYQESGAEVIVNGPENGSTKCMHRANESVGIDNLEKFSQFYLHLLYNLFNIELTTLKTSSKK